MSSSSEPPGRAPAENLRILLVTFFGLGLAPLASGTFGTLGGLALALPLAWAPGLPHWGWLLLLALVLSALGIALGPWAEKFFGRKDPGQFVLDEVAGMLVCLALYDLLVGRHLSFAGYATGFLLFRVADIGKPPPLGRLEKLPAGWGVMLDDLVAGLYAGAALVLLGMLEFTWL